MTEQGRKLSIKERSVGLQSPPKLSYTRDSIIDLNSYLRSDRVKRAKITIQEPQNHRGFGIGLHSANGRSATSFVAPINAPPEEIEIKSGNRVCT